MATRSRRSNAIIALLGDRPVAYHPALAPIVGGVKETIFICQLLYWDGKGKRADGYIWKTQKEWTEETGLSRSELLTVRRNLKKSGLLSEKLEGVPAKLHYRMDVEKLRQMIEAHFDEPEESQFAETLQTSLQESSDLDCRNPANKIAETLQTIPETTQRVPQRLPEITQPPGESEKPSLDPLVDIFNRNTSPEKESFEPPKGWDGVTPSEFDICSYVATLWRGDNLPKRSKEIDKQIAGAAELLDMHAGDVERTKATVSAYHATKDGGELWVAGPHSLTNVLPNFLARTGGNGGKVIKITQ